MKIEQPGVTAFTELSDVPNSYLGAATKNVSVNALETSLEFTPGGGGSIADTYETINQNLKASDATFTYTGDKITAVDYGDITKTIAYSGDKLTSITLSGSTPSGIDLVKTFTYSGDTVTGYLYS
jgi:hypothetical protein